MSTGHSHHAETWSSVMKRKTRKSLSEGMWLLRGLLIVAVLALWELLSKGGVLDSTAVPPMSRVVRSLISLTETHRFWTAMSQTLRGLALATAISVLIAIPIGLVIGRFSLAQASTRLVVDFCQTIPAVALLPLFVLVYGSTFRMKVILAVAAAVWPMLVQTAHGAHDVDAVAADTFRVFQITGVRRVRFLLVPSALPYIMTGLRISGVLSLMMVTTGELLGDAPGLGHNIALAQASAAIPSMWAYVLVIGALGVILNTAFQAAEARLLKWHASHREGDAP